MRKLRLWLMVLGAPAVALLGLREIGGTPISRGYDTGFQWRQEQANHRLVLSADPGGNMTCWVRLKVPATRSGFTAETSTQVQLRVTKEAADSGYEWIAVTKNSTVPEDKFEWPSGSVTSITSQDKSSQLGVADWYVYSSNKNFDSAQRTRWRTILYRMSLVFLGLSLTSGFLEGVEKYRKKREPFSPEHCVKSLIGGVEGTNETETDQMQAILEKVLIEGSTVQDALSPLRLTPIQGKIFWVQTAGRFRAKLVFLISELYRYLSRL